MVLVTCSYLNSKVNVLFHCSLYGLYGLQGWKIVKSLIYSRADNNVANTLCVENKIISKILDSFPPPKKVSIYCNLCVCL